MNPYEIEIKGVSLDFYDVCAALGITNPALQHAFKKLWRGGKGSKSLLRDTTEAKVSLERAIEMLSG